MNPLQEAEVSYSTNKITVTHLQGPPRGTRNMEKSSVTSTQKLVIVKGKHEGSLTCNAEKYKKSIRLEEELLSALLSQLKLIPAEEPLE